MQGGGPTTPARIAAARAHDEAPAADLHSRVVAGIARIRSPLLTVAADVAGPARGIWSGAACAQPMALEIVCGKDRLVTGCGWTPRAGDRQGLRLPPGHSTLTLGEGSTGEPLGGWKAELMGHRLIGRPLHVDVQQRDGEGAVWLEVEHDGWVHDRLKLLVWDGTGVWLCHRRLHQGHFIWPRADTAVFTLSAAQWQWLVSGWIGNVWRLRRQHTGGCEQRGEVTHKKFQTISPKRFG